MFYYILSNKNTFSKLKLILHIMEIYYKNESKLYRYWNSCKKIENEEVKELMNIKKSLKEFSFRNNFIILKK